MEQVNECYEKMQWSTYMMPEHKIVMHCGLLMSKIHIDYEKLDPDGLPLVFFEGQKVTRVRKMTEMEFEECMKRMEELKIIIERKNNEGDPKDNQ